jgi:hypothetical protein
MSRIRTTISPADWETDARKPSYQIPDPVRTPRPPREVLTAESTRLLSELPAEVSPHKTIKEFPHVINRIASTWGRAEEFRLALEDLLLDDRPEREGFPHSVVTELTRLGEYRLAQKSR